LYWKSGGRRGKHWPPPSTGGGGSLVEPERELVYRNSVKQKTFSVAWPQLRQEERGKSAQKTQKNGRENHTRICL